MTSRSDMSAVATRQVIVSIPAAPLNMAREAVQWRALVTAARSALLGS
jgi:hypothetical protein